MGNAFIVRPSGAQFPAGVTLTAIDGGPTYYADHGLTYAANAGWDDPDFIPIMNFLDKFRNSTDSARWDALGMNTMMDVQGDASPSLMEAWSGFLILQAGEWLEDDGNVLYQMDLWDRVVGWNLKDEPSLISDFSNRIAALPNAVQDGRLLYVNYTNTALRFFDLQGVDLDVVNETEYPTPNATTRHLDMVSYDHYYFAGKWDDAVPSEAGACWGLGRSMTGDELQRGCRYLDGLRAMRLGSAPPGGSGDRWQPNTQGPMGIYVDTMSPYDDNDTEAKTVRPAQINAAVWGTIIGGARYVKYFTHGDPFSGGPGLGAWLNDKIVENGNGNEYDTALSGESISNAAQVTATNALVTSLASVINSPFANNYATVSPAPVVMNSSRADSGFDFMVKYHNRGVGANNKFYIFAIPRYGLRTHNAAGVDTGAESWPKTATFTIANTGSTQVTVINESRTISVTGGGTTFSDSFAGPDTVHIYRVD